MTSFVLRILPFLAFGLGAIVMPLDTPFWPFLILVVIAGVGPRLMRYRSYLRGKRVFDDLPDTEGHTKQVIVGLDRFEEGVSRTCNYLLAGLAAGFVVEFLSHSG